MSDTPETDQSTRPEISEIRKAQTWFLGIIAFAVILFLLVQAKFLLISLAIAIMLFSLTSDAINYFQRMRIGSARVSIWIASVLAVLLIATILISASLIIIAQANTVVVTILQYADPAQQAVADLVGWMGADVETAVLDWLKSIQLGPYLSSLAGQAGNIASGAVLVTLFVGFMFLERLWFPTKLASLMGDERRARRVERIISSIIHRVNRYLVVKVVISTVTGALVYAVMTFFALDLAMPMAVLTFILNFIPNIGSIVATVVVALVSYVQTGDAFTGLMVLSIVTVIQFTVGQVLDPLLLGKTLRLSSFGIIASLAFWAAVWGIVGMFLAVPIMVSVMIICSHIPRVRPVAILLSREGLPDLDLEMEPEAEPAKDTAEARPSS
ncbi:AI-2E family transporter [Mameliella sp. CS4]|uniref:AI-2E family transporter n=1 Tax=Mameliella sp. CS4 TaxID=2862329 RepID=UPI001C607884|nr:AI-2E family transporter [Mameliella sp. CS4]MBW4982537.1 AI-2E family transporter [Mameliella sp. CS4]